MAHYKQHTHFTRLHESTVNCHQQKQLFQQSILSYLLNGKSNKKFSVEKMYRSISLVCVLSLLSLTPLVSSASWTCPSPTELDPNNPCECVNRNDIILVAFWVYCTGPEVTQQHVDEFMTLMRTHNDFMTVTPTPKFWLLRTNLTSLDLTFMNNSRWTDVIIWENEQLEEFLGTDPDMNLSFSSADLEQVPAPAVSSLLKVDKVSQNLYTFYWRRSGVGFWMDSPEFAHVMSRLEHVTLLQLHYDNITSVNKAHFSQMKSLSNLQLGHNTEFGDEIMTLGPESLLFPQTGEYPLNVNFYKNRLSNDNISPNSGLANLNGTNPVNLEFGLNQFEYISAENFEGFLNAHPQNSMDFASNPTICDSRMKWLKDGREMYESRVLHMDCTNDVGETIFTTDLV